MTPNRIGSYPIVCAELCGLGHATMRATAVVDAGRQFTAWLGELGKPAAAAQPRRRRRWRCAPAGRQGDLHLDRGGCARCHTLGDAGANGTVGPDLDKVLDGKDAAFIKQSIVDPNEEIADGLPDGIMPRATARPLQPDQLDALVKYLSEVTKGG